MIKPIVAVTLGDVSGVGPEVVIKALNDKVVKRLCFPLVIGARDYLLYENIPTKINTIKVIKKENFSEYAINLWEIRNPPKIRLPKGKVNPISGKISILQILEAVKLIKQKSVHSLVTAPVSKEAINKAGYKFSGHTDFLANLTKTKQIRMLLQNPIYRVVLETVHTPINKISQLLNVSHLYQTIKLANKYLKKIGIPFGRIGVCCLNPHCGEGGLLGNDEKKVIFPAIKKANLKGINTLGPYPPDKLFYEAKNRRFDLIVSMYHDQGLLPLKLTGYFSSVNITLGLPFVRTSPVHGTAFDIAGKNKADCKSMVEAIKACAKLSVL